MASQEDLDKLVNSLKIAGTSTDKKAAIDALHDFYFKSSHPWALRQRALSLCKKASLEMIGQGVEEYEKVAAVIDSAKNTIENAKSIAVSGQQSLILPKTAAHMENVLAVLKEVKGAVDAIHDADEEDIDNAVKAANKVVAEASVIRDKLTGKES